MNKKLQACINTPTTAKKNKTKNNKLHKIYMNGINNMCVFIVYETLFLVICWQRVKLQNLKLYELNCSLKLDAYLSSLPAVCKLEQQTYFFNFTHPKSL